MANPFVKAWRYLMALFNSKIDENADPKIQIQQAIEDAQRQHQALSQQAAQVIGNQRQLEMRLNRQLADIEKLQANVRQIDAPDVDARERRKLGILYGQEYECLFLDVIMSLFRHDDIAAALDDLGADAASPAFTNWTRSWASKTCTACWK